MNKEKLLTGLVVVLLIFNLAGNLPKFNFNTTRIVQSDNSSALTEVQKEFNKIESKEDKLLIYKLIAGSAEYLKASENLKNTGQFDPVLGKVQSSYGWNREKYPKFTDAVSEYLVSEKYNEPKQLLTKEDRANFANIFEKLSEVLK